MKAKQTTPPSQTAPPVVVQRFWQRVMQRLLRDRLTLAAIIVFGVILLATLFAGVLSTFVLEVDPNRADLSATFARASAEHWLGADQLGRDQLARLLHGGRISLGIAVFGTLIALLLAIVVGAPAGFYGGPIDDLLMWLINTVSAVPSLFLLLIVASFYTVTPVTMVLLFGLLGWIEPARLVRGQVLAVREQEYVLAARAIGRRPISILYRHILPNVLPLLVIVTMREVGRLILAESALSYLGLGIQPPRATWGGMLGGAQQHFLFAPHLLIFPGLLITLTVLCLYVIGDGVRDALDPYL